MSVRSVQRAVKSLARRRHLLSQISKGTGGRGVFTEYKILFQEYPEDAKAKKEGKFCWIPKWIIDYILRDLTEPEVRVFLVYTRHANADGLSWPGNPLLSYKTGLSVRSVQRAVKRLKTKGLLFKVSKGSGGRKVYTVYRIISKTWQSHQQETMTDNDMVSEGAEADSAETETVSELALSTNYDRAVMVCGKQATKHDSIESGYAGNSSVNHDTPVASSVENVSQNEKPCHHSRKTMTPQSLNHDRAMASEVISKKVSKGDGAKVGGNKQRQRITTGIEVAVKGLFRTVNSVCNTRSKADKMIQDLNRHLAKPQAVGV